MLRILIGGLGKSPRYQFTNPIMTIIHRPRWLPRNGGFWTIHLPLEIDGIGTSWFFSPSSAREYGGCLNPWFDVFTTFTETMLVKPKLSKVIPYIIDIFIYCWLSQVLFIKVIHSMDICWLLNFQLIRIICHCWPLLTSIDHYQSWLIMF